MMEEDILQGRVGNMQRFSGLKEGVVVMDNSSPRDIIAKGVKESTKITQPEKVKELTEKALKGESVAQNGNYDIFLFDIAESLERIKCETSSMNEYFGWIDKTQHIMNNMTDGFVSVQDINEKKEFIANSWQREAEILICLGLYERSNNPLAKQRYSEMMLKLRRLRQLRSALVNNTKSTPDKKPLSQQEKARLAHIVQTLEEMKRLDEEGNYNDPRLIQHLRLLEISHENDIEFYPNYSFYTRMLEDQRHRYLDIAKVRTYDYSRRLEEARHKIMTKDEISERIMRLTGRKQLTSEEQALLLRNQNLRHAQSFDAEKYRRIQELRKRQLEQE